MNMDKIFFKVCKEFMGYDEFDITGIDNHVQQLLMEKIKDRKISIIRDTKELHICKESSYKDIDNETVCTNCIVITECDNKIIIDYIKKNEFVSGFVIPLSITIGDM